MTDWAAYDDVFKKVDVDDRLGNVTIEVKSIERKTTKAGDREYYEATVNVLEAGGYEMRWFLNPAPPSPLEIEEALKAGNRGKARGMRNNVNAARVLAESYGVNSPDDIKPGMTFSVHTERGKDRLDKLTGTTKPGFIEVMAVLPKGATNGKPGAAAINPADIPF